MIYIMVALKAEAQAFVDKYKLQNYKNSDISVIISGIGSLNMKNSTLKVLKNFKKDDIIINVGICGASKKYKISQLLDAREHDITCIDYEANDERFEIVDMESSGFIDATKDIKNSFIFKVVSDHFQPHKVTKDKAKSLIFNHIENIMQKVKT